MTKRKSETVGVIRCPFCLSTAEVAQTPGKEYRYIYCQADGCKATHNYGQAFQDYIADNMREDIEGEAETVAVEVRPLPEFAPKGDDVAQGENVTPETPAETAEAGGGFWPWE